MEMITHGADKIINSADDLMIDDDTEEIIQRGEEHTEVINKKYEGFNFDDLNNFKSDSMLQFEGEDCRNGRQALGLSLLSLFERERKLNYSVDVYYKETMRAGPSNKDKPARVPRAPKQINTFVRCVPYSSVATFTPPNYKMQKL